MRHWSSLQSKLQLLSFAAALEQQKRKKCLRKKVQEKQAIFLPSLPLQSRRATVRKPVTFASVMLITAWAITHSKTHHRDQWKKDCCWLSNGDSSHSQDRRDWQRDISHWRQDNIYSQKENFQLMCPSFFSTPATMCLCVCNPLFAQTQIDFSTPPPPPPPSPKLSLGFLLISLFCVI